MKTLTVLQEHSEVLAHWASWGWDRERLLVFDEHLDLKAIAASRLSRIAQTLHAREDINVFNRRSLLEVPTCPLFGFDDFLYAAWRLGMVQQIHWVLPSPRGALECSRVLWSALECIDGIGEEAARNWSIQDWGVQTVVDGLVLRCSGEHGLLLAPNDHSQVDFDLDYFDREVATAPAAVARVGELLGNLNLRDHVKTATLSISNGFLQSAGIILPDLMADEFGFETVSMPAIGADISVLRDLHKSNTSRTPANSGSRALPPAFEAVFAIRSGEIADALAKIALLPMDREAGWPNYEIRLALIAQRRYVDILGLPLRLDESADTPWVRAACLQTIAYCRLERWSEATTLLDEMVQRWPMLLSLYPIAILTARAVGDESRVARLIAARRQLHRTRDDEDERDIDRV